MATAVFTFRLKDDGPGSYGSRTCPGRRYIKGQTYQTSNPAEIEEIRAMSWFAILNDAQRGPVPAADGRAWTEQDVFRGALEVWGADLGAQIVTVAKRLLAGEPLVKTKDLDLARDFNPKGPFGIDSIPAILDYQAPESYNGAGEPPPESVLDVRYDSLFGINSDVVGRLERITDLKATLYPEPIAAIEPIVDDLEDDEDPDDIDADEPAKAVPPPPPKKRGRPPKGNRR